ncbi:MAG TPA: response regulator transcription factor [Mycobacteriales bacterium]|nr:response regulator transcription factor [Mycobacteriales bacterium]
MVLLSCDAALCDAIAAALAGSRFATVVRATSAARVAGSTTVAWSAVCLVDADVAEGARGAVRRLCETERDLPVVVLARVPDTAEFLDLIRLGARGYAVVGAGLGRLAHVVADVSSGGVSVPRVMLPALYDEFRRRDRYRRTIEGQERPALTDREHEVLELLVAGHSTAEIAHELFVSPVTVRTHVAAVVRKLRLPNRSAVVHLVDSGDGGSVASR